MSLMRVSSTIREAQEIMSRSGKTDRIYYCYRCYACSRLITKIEVLEGRYAARANVCPCGSRTIQVTNPKWWEELFLPRCWKLIYAIKRRLIAPPPPPPTPQEQADAERTARAAMRAFEEHLMAEARK